MHSLWRDIRYGWQQITKAPGTSLTAILSLAVGIAANTIVFSWLQTLVLKPLPGVSGADRLVVFTLQPRGSNMGHSLSDLDARDLAERGEIFQGVAMYGQSRLRYEDDRRRLWVWAQPVAGSFFSVLGVEAARGRVLPTAPLGRQSAEPEVVVSDRFWREVLGGDAGVIGRSVRLNRVPFTVIGVTPPGFQGAVGGLAFDLWVPVASTPLMQAADGPLSSRGAPWLYAMARLRPGVSLREASEVTTVVSQRLEREYPDTNRGRSILVFPLWRCPYGSPGFILPLLRILMVVAALVLLLILANLASILLARASTRGKELAVRQALGASRLRLVRQILTESLLLALLGGATGALLSVWGVGLLRLVPPRTHLPVAFSLSLDPDALLFALALALVSGVVFGLSPALQLSRLARGGALKADGRTVGVGGGRRRLRQALVVIESALATLVLVGAGLCLKSFQSAQQIDRGFDPEGVLVARLTDTSDGRSAAESRALRRRLLDDLRGMPSVAEVSLAGWVPLGPQGIRGVGIQVDGYQPKPGENMGAAITVVSPRHLANLRAPIVDGRALAETDDEHGTEAMVVNQSMAQHFWPGRSPVGRHVRMWGRRFRVVGVAQDWKHHDLREAPLPLVIVSYLQADLRGTPEVGLRDTILFVRSRQDPRHLAGALERRIQSLDPGLYVQDAIPMIEYIDIAVAPQRMAAVLMSSLASGALLLAFMGIFGVLAYVVSQRQREIGVRAALGASPATIIRLVLRQGLWLILPGVGLGLVLATSLSRVLSGFLIGVRPFDPAIYLAAAVLLAVVGVLACLVPARRALEVDPVTALRSD